MPVPDEPTSKKVAESPQSAATPATGDVENQALGTGAGVSNIVRRWKKEDLLKRGSLGLRGLGLLFSLLAFIIMVSNEHGDWKEFDQYEEYRYVLAIAILSSLYTGLQILRQIHELSTGREIISRKNLLIVDFFGDQIVAYFLISAASSAVPLTNRMREEQDNIFTDSSASAISMEFFAFILLALSAMISGYKLSNQSYI
ncbi:CASP-like protein 4B1 [Olea europaea var. sylvestris]|uniref:CASP-like protein 4B1 n=1 Tax=Olea europaea var. sylvestris TaxID=158386 RepID=UPI000C1CD4D8|nr:CASP-like protein 4B1 [Olea europaea var. sylvestris]